MQAPKFWRNPPEKPGLLAHTLSPLSAIWRGATARRLNTGPWHKVRVPVICVGNLNIGGTGKTPTVIALAERLKSQGFTPHVVSRGYGGVLEGPVRVNGRKHKAAEVGDEPVLLAAFCETWVSKDRHAGAVEAVKAGADVILLDDGLQNPSLAKDLSIVVVDAGVGFGNQLVFPAGPLREPTDAGLARADVVLVIGGAKKRREFLASAGLPADLPVIEAELKPLDTGMEWENHKVLAFAGIGRPEKFFATLRGLGADIIHAEALSDHQPLNLRLLNRLEADAFFKGAQLVTTEKDATRLPEEFRFRVLTLPVRLAIKDQDVLDIVLKKAGLTPR